MAADGSIVFSTALDNSELEKGLREAENDIDALKKKIEEKTSERNAIAEQLVDAKKQIQETEESIASLKQRLEELHTMQPTAENPQEAIDARIAVVEKELAAKEKLYDQQLTAGEKIAKQWYKVNSEVEAYNAKLSQTQTTYNKLGTSAQNFAATAKTKITNAANSLVAPWENMANRAVKALKKVFIFSMIVKGVRALKSELSSVMMQNQAFSSGIQNLKAVMTGYIDAFAMTILPAMTAIVNTIAAIFERVAGFIDSIFGTNIMGAIQSSRSAASSAIAAENAEKLAEAQNDQAKSAKNLAKEQKKANKQLLSFDELNVLSEESSDDAADAMDGLADAVSSPDLTPDWTQGFAPDFGVLDGIISWLDMLRDRILNDVEGPFARIREGLQLIKQGWDELTTGIMTGNWSMMWAGIRDIAVGALYVIEGAFTAFLDWLDEATGGRFHEIIEGVKSIVHGAVEFIDGLLHGDLELAVKGVHDMISGLSEFISGIIELLNDLTLGTISGIFDGIKTLVANAFDELRAAYPQFSAFIDGIETVVMAALGAIEGAIGGAVTFVNETLSGLVDSVGEIMSGLVDTIVGIFTGNGDKVTEGLRGIFNGFISAVESLVNSAVDGLIWMLNSIIDALNMIPGQSWGYASTPYITLPRLASGAIIPPNREFMAILGDQTSGTNIETPEYLMRQVVREEAGSANAQMLMVLQQILSAIQNGHTLECDGYTLAKVVNTRNGQVARMLGK